MIRQDRQGNNCRVFNVVITLRRDDIVVTAERDDYTLDGTHFFAGPYREHRRDETE